MMMIHKNWANIALFLLPSLPFLIPFVCLFSYFLFNHFRCSLLIYSSDKNSKIIQSKFILFIFQLFCQKTTAKMDRSILVPYTSRLLSEIAPGQTLNIHGNVNAEAQRFEINLLSNCFEIDPHMGSAPLHCSVRFDEGKIVLNSFAAGEWGKEERHTNPFAKGQPFDIRFRVHDDRFEIFANQKQLTEFKHRILYTNIDHIQVRGDVTLSGVHWGGRYFEIPFQANFHGTSLKSGQRLFVYGIPKGDFSVNLVGTNGDRLFHLNPRFSEKKIVRGSQKDGVWGEEEREGTFPLKKGQAVDIAVFNEPYSLQIFINGSHYCAFAHRAEPSSDYKFVRIEGDIELTGLEVGQ